MALYRRMVRVVLGVTLGLIALPGSPACSRASAPVIKTKTANTPIRDVRVRLFSNAPRIRLRSESPLRIVDDPSKPLPVAAQDEWLILSVGPDKTIHLGGSATTKTTISIHAEDASPISISLPEGSGWQEPRIYPGSLRVELNDKGNLRGINEVDIEDYIGCVVGWEAWPTFEPAALRAQAIAARTYALDQMIRRNELNHDMSATQGDQVYHGIRDDQAGQRARKATAQTRGVVCTWGEAEQETMFPAYYSAACGGRSQSAAIFGQESDVPPLVGDVKCDYCKIAPGETYRWGPVRMRLDEVRSKLRSRIPELSSIKKMEVSQRTSAGRPVTIRVTDAKGSSHTIQAERLRHALGPSRIKSTDFTLRVEGGSVVFGKGRGFGHGLGFCQWGAQGQALKGKKAAEILRFYYPGSKLGRAY